MTDTIAWVAAEILPHEADVRQWLRRSSFHLVDEDDVVQEAYARIAGMSDVAHVGSPRAYFFTVVRNIAFELTRRARAGPISPVEDFDALVIVDDGPDPEQAAGDRQEFRRIAALIQGLPEKHRQVFIMRRIEGLSQKEIARRLGVPESTIEKRAAKGLRLLLEAMGAGASNAVRARRGE